MSKLERIIHDNSNGLDYILVGEIYLPLIAVPEEKREIGFYGSLHRNYLKDYKSGLYESLFLCHSQMSSFLCLLIACSHPISVPVPGSDVSGTY